MTSNLFHLQCKKKLTKDNPDIIHSSDGTMYLSCSIDFASKWYVFPISESESVQAQQS